LKRLTGFVFGLARSFTNKHDLRVLVAGTPNTNMVSGFVERAALTMRITRHFSPLLGLLSFFFFDEKRAGFLVVE
jgi:hypothetical protein